jgi:hypothetical protein
MADGGDVQPRAWPRAARGAPGFDDGEAAPGEGWAMTVFPLGVYPHDLYRVHHVGYTDRHGRTVWLARAPPHHDVEGAALLSAGLGLAPRIGWVGVLFAIVGLYRAVWSRA